MLLHVKKKKFLKELPWTLAIENILFPYLLVIVFLCLLYSVFCSRFWILIHELSWNYPLTIIFSWIWSLYDERKLGLMCNSSIFKFSEFFQTNYGPLGLYILNMALVAVRVTVKNPIYSQYLIMKTVTPESIISSKIIYFLTS